VAVETGSVGAGDMVVGEKGVQGGIVLAPELFTAQSGTPLIRNAAERVHPRPKD